MEIKKGLMETNFEGLKVKVSADEESLCDPNETLDNINDYETIQLEFFQNDKKIVMEANSKVNELLNPYLHDDIFNDKLYGYVPLQTAIEAVSILNKEETIKEIKKEESIEETARRLLKMTENISNENVSTTKKTFDVIETALTTLRKKFDKKSDVDSRKLTMKQSVKIVNEIIDVLNNKIYEKEEEVRSLMVALLSKENVLLIGNPGEGKTALVKELSNVLKDGNYFGHLMKEDTMYDDLFGGMNTNDYLEEGVVNRTAKGMIQSANIVFLDEIFKSNGGVLNGILDLVNEREFDNNGIKQKTPLVTSIGASNEFPDEEDNLEAFYDRFLLKHWVSPMENERSFINLFKGEHEKLEVPKITLNELEQIHVFVNKVKVEDHIYRNLYDITMDVRNAGYELSTRRVGKCINVLKANAFIDGRTSVVIEDFMILRHIFWNDIEDKDDITDIITPYSFNKVKLQLVSYKQDIDNVMRNYRRIADANKNEGAIEYGQKLKTIQLEVQKLVVDAGNDKELKDEIKNTLDELKKLTREIHESALSSI